MDWAAFAKPDEISPHNRLDFQVTGPEFRAFENDAYMVCSKKKFLSFTFYDDFLPVDFNHISQGYITGDGTRKVTRGIYGQVDHMAVQG